MTATRIYIVTDKETGQQKMVEASSNAQALRKATEETFESRVATTVEVVSYMKSGGDIIDANKEDTVDFVEDDEYEGETFDADEAGEEAA